MPTGCQCFPWRSQNQRLLQGLSDVEFGTVFDITKYDGNARTFKRARDAYDLMVSYIETSVQSVWRRQVEALEGGPVVRSRGATVLNRSTPGEGRVE